MEGQIKESLPTAGKNKLSNGLFPVLPHFTPQSYILSCPCSSQHGGPKNFPVPPVVHIHWKAVCQDARHPAFGSVPSIDTQQCQWTPQEHINDQGNRRISLQQPPFIKLGKQSVHLPAQRGASGPFTRRRGGGTKYEKTEKEHQHAGMRFLILCDVRRLLTFWKKSQMTAVF